MNKKTNKLINYVIIGIVIGAIFIFGATKYQENRKNLIVNAQNNLEIYKTIKTLADSDLILMKTIQIVISESNQKYNDLSKKIEQIPELIKETKLNLEKKLKQVNIMVVNKTIGAGRGSGATLKYKGKFYVLSAGHMAEKNTDKLFLYENNQEICELEIVKQDYSVNLTKDGNDLLLLRPKDSRIVPRVYVELADIEPETSNELYIVGNPMGISDVLSDARVIMYEGNFMYMITTSSYFGNSGGGIFNSEGNLVGIISHLIPIQPFPDKIYQPGNRVPAVIIPGVPAWIIHGAVRLEVILRFMEGVN